MKYLQISKQGINRKSNLDDTLVLSKQDNFLFVIFDGVSSNENALLAIETAKNYIVDEFEKHIGKTDISNLIKDVNSKILEKKVTGALTTISALFIDSNSNLSFLNIGDSRIYSIYSDHINLETTDDRLSGSSNIITKCLGMDSLVNEDFQFRTLNSSSDRLLLCTDGFYNFLEKDKFEFFKALNFSRFGDIKNFLLKEIIDNEDDSTALLVKLN